MWKIFSNKKGADMAGLAKGIIIGILGIVVALSIFSAATPVLLGVLGNVTANLAGIPLLSFFAKDGILILIFVVVILLAVVAYMWKMVHE